MEKMEKVSIAVDFQLQLVVEFVSTASHNSSKAFLTDCLFADSLEIMKLLILALLSIAVSLSFSSPINNLPKKTNVIPKEIDPLLIAALPKKPEIHFKKNGTLPNKSDTIPKKTETPLKKTNPILKKADTLLKKDGELLNDVNKKILKGIDFSDIDDAVSDKLKNKFADLSKKGIGKSEKELTNIRRKLKIIRKISKAQGIDIKDVKADVDGGTSSAVDEILYAGDLLLNENQLDGIIEGISEKSGLDKESLATLGVNNIRNKRQAIRNPSSTPLSNNRWPTGSIPYAFDANISTTTRNIIDQAFINIQNQTCLTFYKNSAVSPRVQFRDIDPTKCFSTLGFYGGDNRINIAAGQCEKNYGTISHEILHTLGIHHHQARYDRDNYISNAGEAALTTDNSFNYGSPYDYGSVLHYGTDIVTFDEPLYQQTIGNRKGPTFQDIALLNRHYNCKCTSPTVTCVNGGYPNPADCSKCNCPGGWGGVTCSSVNAGTFNNGASHTSGTFNANTNDECRSFTFTIGTDNDEEYQYPKNVWYHIKAPTGKQVQLIVLEADAAASYGKGCPLYGVEMKTNNFNRTGYLICANNEDFVTTDVNEIKKFTTEGDRAMIQLYSRKNQLTFKVNFRYVDSSNEDDIPDSCRPSVECMDIDTSCEYWAENGECDNFPDFMRTNCPASCNFQNCECKNVDSDAQCESWAAFNNQCETAAGYMSANCRKTCGLCGANAFAQ